MPTHGQYKSNRLCNGQRGSLASYHDVRNLIILDENANADNYVTILSENLLDSVENIWQQKSIHSCFNMAMFRPTQRVELSHGWSRTYLPINGHPSPRTLMQQNKFGILWAEIVRVMPFTRNDLIRALHNSWLNITVP